MLFDVLHAYKAQKLTEISVFFTKLLVFPIKNIFAFSSTHLWNTTSQSIFELYKHVRHQKASKVVKLFISRKKNSICLFPTKISNLDLKTPLFLGKRGKKWWETDKLKKKGTA